MEFNQNLWRGEGFLYEIPSMGEVWIFYGTTQYYITSRPKSGEHKTHISQLTLFSTGISLLWSMYCSRAQITSSTSRTFKCFRKHWQKHLFLSPLGSKSKCKKVIQKVEEQEKNGREAFIQVNAIITDDLISICQTQKLQTQGRTIRNRGRGVTIPPQKNSWKGNFSPKKLPDLPYRKKNPASNFD